MVDDAFDLAAVDAEFAGYGALAAACALPVPHRLLRRWRASWHEWRTVTAVGATWLAELGLRYLAVNGCRLQQAHRW